MPEIDVLNLNNEKVGSLTLDEAVFGRPKNTGLVHEAVTMQLASRRQGNAATKTKGLVSGGGKKPWKQKGTGRARAGSTRSPIWKGGGTTFGPLPRSYGYAFPKKKGRAALFSLLADKARSGRLTVVEELELTEPKTRLLAKVLAKLGLGGTVLIASAQRNEAVERASRNLPGVRLLDVRNLNPYDLLRYEHLLMSRRDVTRLAEIWKKDGEEIKGGKSESA